MRADEHVQAVVERDGVVATLLAGSQRIDEAVAVLDRAESAAGVPLVDEAERARLRALAEGTDDRPPHWHSVLARRSGEPVGYAGIVVAASGSEATADVAVDRMVQPCEPTLRVLFDALLEVAAGHGAGRLVVWVRHADPTDVDCAEAAGLTVDRRLVVMRRGLDTPVPPADLPPGVRLRAYRPGEDDDAVVGVLAAAYDGTPEAGWDHARLAARRTMPWFDPQDLLVAVAPGGEAVGLHWTKRRSSRVGEVYNLAVAPRMQGRGLGRALLRAGLRHLAARGCHRVLLWVNEDNRDAIELYTAHGFAEVWQDVAFARDLA